MLNVMMMMSQLLPVSGLECSICALMTKCMRVKDSPVIILTVIIYVGLVAEAEGVCQLVVGVKKRVLKIMKASRWFKTTFLVAREFVAKRSNR
jgi:hypothetical protein